MSAAREQLRTARHLLRMVVLGSVAGMLAGVACFVFLEGLDRATDTRTAHPTLVWCLPLAGLAIGLAHWKAGGRAVHGSELLIDAIHEPGDWLPRRLPPMVLLGTWATHLFGGSGGREGAALQMSGGLADTFARLTRRPASDRRVLLTASVAGGFGAAFGVPLAGAVFALEVPSIGRLRYDGLVPALTASVVGDFVVERLGYHHEVRSAVAARLDTGTAAKIAVAGVVFGLTGAAFSEAVRLVRRAASRISWSPLRPLVGGALVVGFWQLFGDDYLGLSLPLIDRALGGEHLGVGVVVLKLAVTAVTLGCGFPGGEVTPLLVIGATLGAVLAIPLGVPVGLLAAVGFASVFAGASNTPLASTIMGVELFGNDATVALAIGCVVAYVVSSHRGIYSAQRIAVPKAPNRPPSN